MGTTWGAVSSIPEDAVIQRGLEDEVLGDGIDRRERLWGERSTAGLRSCDQLEWLMSWSVRRKA